LVALLRHQILRKAVCRNVLYFDTIFETSHLRSKGLKQFRIAARHLISFIAFIKHSSSLSFPFVLLACKFNPLTLNDHYRGRTAPLTYKRFIVYIYSTNIGTGYFKLCIYCPFFSLQNAVCFIILTCLVPVLFIFYIQGVLKLKKK